MTRMSYQCTLRDDGSLPLLSHCVTQKSCNLVHDNVPRSARNLSSTEPSPNAPISPSSSSTSTPSPMAAAPPESSVLSLLNGISPRLAVKELEVVPSARLQRLYNVKVTEGPSLLLALPPPAVIRLLRSEKSTLGTEAAVLKWLSAVARERKICSGAGAKESTSRTVGNPLVNETNAQLMTGYLPTLVRHESIAGVQPVEYNLIRPPRGTPISTLSRPLDSREQWTVDFQTGQLLRRISSQVSPTRRFGIAADVLSVPPSVVHHPPQRFEGSLADSNGADSWRVAFHSLLESVLRDGEDLTIMFNYNNIRHHFERFQHLLDAVTKPRLVVLDAGEDSNTLIHRPYESEKKSHMPLKEVQSQPKLGKGVSRKPDNGGKVRQDYTIVFQDDTNIKEEYMITDEPSQNPIEVTGLRQWSNCVFGDPLLATIFSKRPRPTDDFWRGFDKPLPGETTTSIIEDRDNAHIRMLLYECYHAVVTLVGEYYRPQTDSSRRELAARKHLGNVLARLEELDDRDQQRRRRMSGEISPAKRPRSGQESDEDSEP
ncbi:hypothetical protein NOF04DRAFT_1037069 [Fusarium oxysporum II5]|uniref:Uncharacterized protein n=3 Tax=Fusarium oxysporum species complex TaxID=171631 RepID=N1RS41_FUSC4|nr:hypothetical protein FOC4_g10013106 [Fusarium odoratissimum]KAH7212406.1 hypothetical protein DER44DRAFT_222163 [Fusarium oxysporum]KAK2133028.1 hypothetical protein NOF04DRAFT_1037069 [Fusarium oxysporum II5]TXC07575.1 hypothetical protein FocTR4_00003198 [Fusarium oxysporum f. sp. cubense]